jgi:hypothetical protein
MKFISKLIVTYLKCSFFCFCYFYSLKGIELLITQDVPHICLMATECGGSTSVDLTQDSPVMDTFLCTELVQKIDLN